MPTNLIPKTNHIGPVTMTLPGGETRIVESIEDAALLVKDASDQAVRNGESEIRMSPKVNDADFLSAPMVRPIVRPRLSQHQRVQIIHSIRESWSSGNTFVGGKMGNASPSQNVELISASPPSFDRPRRMISLEDE